MPLSAHSEVEAFEGTWRRGVAWCGKFRCKPIDMVVRERKMSRRDVVVSPQKIELALGLAGLLALSCGFPRTVCRERCFGMKEYIPF